MLQTSLNGTRPAEAHPALPITPWALAQDARAVADLGVHSVHVHPRQGDGTETIDARYVGDVVTAIRSVVPAMEISVPSGRWVQPCPRQRIEAVAAWGLLGPARPDLVAVNVHEQGWWEICARACQLGIGVELGVWTPGDAVQLRQVGTPPGTVRVVAEVTVADPLVAVGEADRILRALGPVELPLLLHGEESGAWAVLEYAVAMQLDTRIGLEDVLDNPNGWPTSGNAELVREALRVHVRGGRPTCVPDRRRLARLR